MLVSRRLPVVEIQNDRPFNAACTRPPCTAPFPYTAATLASSGSGGLALPRATGEIWDG
jgi:hypothetical protein